MNIAVKITDHEVKAALQSLASRVKDMKHCMDRIGVYYLKSVHENFDKQCSPDGTPWKKLSEGTMMLYLGQERTSKTGKVSRPYLRKGGALSAKGRKYLQGKRILIESGDLRESIHPQATSHSVTIGTDGSIPYAAIHQFGGSIKPRHKKALSFGYGPKGGVTIPARPYLAVNRGGTMELAEKDKKMILGIIDEYLAP